MEFNYIAMIALKGILYVSSSASLLALCMYIFLALRGNSPTLLSTIDARRMNWKEKLFLGFAAVGFLVCMFQGAATMLFWIPDSWGMLDEDGEFQTIRTMLAGTFASVSGLAFIIFIDEATREKAFRLILREQIESERKVHTATSFASLDILKSDFERKIKDLESKVPRELGEKPLRVEYLRIQAYRELLSLIGTRIGAIHTLRETECSPTSEETGKDQSLLERGNKTRTSKDKDLLMELVDAKIRKELANMEALARMEAPGINALKKWMKDKWLKDVLPGEGVEVLERQGLVRWMEEGLEEMMEEGLEALMEEGREALEALGQEALKEVAEDIAANLRGEGNRRRTPGWCSSSPAPR